MNARFHGMRGVAWVFAVLASACGGDSPTSAPPPPGTFAYAAFRDDAGGNVSAYRVDTATGHLTLLESHAVPAPGRVIADPARRFLYVSNRTSDRKVDVFVYRIEAATGRLTTVGRFAGGGHANQAPGALAASSQLLFMTTGATTTGYRNKTWAYRVKSSGTLSPVGEFSLAFEPEALSVNPTGQFLYLTAQQSYGDRAPILRALRVGSTGAIEEFAELVITGCFPTAAMDPLGDFLWLGAEGDRGTLASFDVRAVDGVPIPIEVLSADVAGLVAHPSGRYLYAAQGREAITTYAVARPSGRVSRAGALAAAQLSTSAMAIDQQGTLLYVSSRTNREIRAFGIDASNGALRAIGRVAPGGAGLAVIQFQ